MTEWTVETVTGPAALEAYAEAHKALALSGVSATASCFTLPFYLETWAKHLAGTARIRTLTVRKDGLVHASMPMMRHWVSRGPMAAPRHDFAPQDRAFFSKPGWRPLRLRQLSPIVSMPASLIGPAPLAAPSDYGPVTNAIAAEIAADSEWDTFAVPVDAGEHQQAWIDALQANGLKPWVLTLDRSVGAIASPKPFDEIVGQQKKKFRQNIRRARAAADKAGMELHVAEGHSSVRANFNILNQIATQSWKQPGGRGADLVVPYTGDQERFSTSLLFDNGPESGIDPVLVWAECEDQLLAAILCLRCRDWLTALIIFHVPGVLGNASPGMLVLGRSIDWAHDNGIVRYDLNATHEWTRYLIDETREQHIVVCYAPSVLGQTASAVSRLARRIK